MESGKCMNRIKKKELNGSYGRFSYEDLSYYQLKKTKPTHFTMEKDKDGFDRVEYYIMTAKEYREKEQITDANFWDGDEIDFDMVYEFAEDYHNEQLRLLNVSQQRELLIDFLFHLNKKGLINKFYKPPLYKGRFSFHCKRK